MGSKYAYNMRVLRGKLLSESKTLCFSESVEFEKVYVRFLINKIFKIVRSLSSIPQNIFFEINIF